MLKYGYIVRHINRKAPYDGSQMMLICSKKKGLTLVKLKGLKRIPLQEFEPHGAGVNKIGCSEPHSLPQRETS